MRFDEKICYGWKYKKGVKISIPEGCKSNLMEAAGNLMAKVPVIGY